MQNETIEKRVDEIVKTLYNYVSGCYVSIQLPEGFSSCVKIDRKKIKKILVQNAKQCRKSLKESNKMLKIVQQRNPNFTNEVTEFYKEHGVEV